PRRLLRGPVEPRVVDRDRGAGGDLRGERAVLVAVAAAGRREAECDHTEDAPPGLERDPHRALAVAGRRALEIARGGDPPRLASLSRLDDAPVAQERDREPGEPGKGRLVLERRAQDRARLSEEPEPLVGMPALGDVAEDVDRVPDGAVLAE